MAGAVRARVKINPEVMKRAHKRLAEHEKSAHESERKVSVGIHEEDGSSPKLDYDYKDGEATLAQVAAAHEFGAGVPERSWLRTWFDQNRNRLIREMVDVMHASDRGDHGAFERQGDEWATELRDWIEHQDAGMKSLQPSTVAEKKKAGLSSPETPLFATGQLVAAIKAMVSESK